MSIAVVVDCGVAVVAVSEQLPFVVDVEKPAAGDVFYVAYPTLCCCWYCCCFGNILLLTILFLNSF